MLRRAEAWGLVPAGGWGRPVDPLTAHSGELLLTGFVRAGAPRTPVARLTVRSGIGRLPELTFAVR